MCSINKLIVLVVVVGAIVAGVIFFREKSVTSPDYSPKSVESRHQEKFQEIDPKLHASLNEEYLKQKSILEAKAFVPITPWQEQRVETIRSERIDQIIANLADFDDVHLASTSLSRGFTPDSPESVGVMLSRLFRVRRILEEAEQHPKEVAQKMKDLLADALARWPDEYKKELAMRIELGRLNRPSEKEKPTQHDKLRLQAEAATYILAEIPDHSALPVLVASYRRQQVWIDEIPVEKYKWIAQCPVPPPTNLYAMHRIISTYPKDMLPPKALDAHRAYMKWADTNLPPLKVYDGVRSTSKYDESDMRNKMASPDGLLLANEPKISLTVYPAYFKDWTRMQQFEAAPYVTEESKKWFTLIEAFNASIQP